MLTKKHFQALANIVREMHHKTGRDNVICLAIRLEEFCQSTNPQFDKEKFWQACGFKKQGG